MLRRLLDFLPLLGALLLALLCGYLLGRLVTLKVSLPAAPIAVRDLSRPLVPTVRIDGVSGGNVEGVIVGGARLVIGEEIIVPDGSGAFRVPAAQFCTRLVTVAAPEGTRFVASKRGKKYYLVDSPQAAGLSPGNLVFFKTAEEAEAKGYRR
jgi:hypothetical protein